MPNWTIISNAPFNVIFRSGHGQTVAYVVLGMFAKETAKLDIQCFTEFENASFTTNTTGLCVRMKDQESFSAFITHLDNIKFKMDSVIVDNADFSFTVKPAPSSDYAEQNVPLLELAYAVNKFCALPAAIISNIHACKLLITSGTTKVNSFKKSPGNDEVPYGVWQIKESRSNGYEGYSFLEANRVKANNEANQMIKCVSLCMHDSGEIILTVQVHDEAEYRCLNAAIELHGFPQKICPVHLIIHSYTYQVQTTDMAEVVKFLNIPPIKIELSEVTERLSLFLRTTQERVLQQNMHVFFRSLEALSRLRSARHTDKTDAAPSTFQPRIASPD